MKKKKTEKEFIHWVYYRMVRKTGKPDMNRNQRRQDTVEKQST